MAGRFVKSYQSMYRVYGLIEIADLYVVNKSDRSGADRLSTTLNNMLDTNPSLHSKCRIPVLKTNALNNEGTDELVAGIQDHFTFIKKEGILKEKINDSRDLEVKIFKILLRR